MSRETLARALNKLNEDNTRVMFNPTVNDVRMFAPHLEMSEAAEILIRGREEKECKFIGPPLKIRGAEHVYAIRLNDAGTTDLVYRGVYRRRESYCHTDVPPKFVDHEFEYRERVSDYAEVYWGRQLVWDRSKSFIEFALLFPDAMDHEDYSAHVHWMASFSDTWERMKTAGKNGYPLVQVLEQNLLVVTSSPYIAVEMRGSVLPLQSYNCAHCGGALTVDDCSFCGRKTNRGALGMVKIMTENPMIPVPAGVYAASESTHSFTTNLMQAIKAHYSVWAIKDFTQPVFRDSRGTRVITLRDDADEV